MRRRQPPGRQPSKRRRSGESSDASESGAEEPDAMGHGAVGASTRGGETPSARASAPRGWRRGGRSARNTQHAGSVSTAAGGAGAGDQPSRARPRRNPRVDSWPNDAGIAERGPALRPARRSARISQRRAARRLPRQHHGSGGALGAGGDSAGSSGSANGDWDDSDSSISSDPSSGAESPPTATAIRAMRTRRELRQHQRMRRQYVDVDQFVDDQRCAVRATDHPLALALQRSTRVGFYPLYGASTGSRRSALTGSHVGGWKRPNLLLLLRDRQLCRRFQPAAIASQFLPRGSLRSTSEVAPFEAARIHPDDLDDSVYTVRFSASGQYMVTSTRSGLITVSESRDDYKNGAIFSAEAVSWCVSDLVTSPDEQFIAYSSLNGVLHICNMSGERRRHEALVLDEGCEVGLTERPTFSLQFANGGAELVAGVGNRLVAYDIERKKTVAQTIAHCDDVNAVALADNSFKSNVIVSGSDDTRIRIWDRRCLHSARSSVGVLVGHTEGITHVHSKGDGVYVLSNGKDQCAKLWDLRMAISDAEHTRRFRHIPLSGTHDYRWEYYEDAGAPGAVVGDTSVMTYRGHRVSKTLIRAYISPESTTGGRYVVAGSSDGIVRVWDVLSGYIEETYTTSGLVRDVCWHPHLPEIVAGGENRTIFTFNAGGGSQKVALGGKERGRSVDDDDELWLPSE